MGVVRAMGVKAVLDRPKWQDLVVNAVVVAASAALTYVVQNQGKVDLGQWTPAVVAVASIALSYLQKFVVTPVPVVPVPTPNNSDTNKEHDFPIK